MAASTADWSAFTPTHSSTSGFELLIGEKLRTSWDSITREQLPGAMLSAIDALFEPPVSSATIGRNFVATTFGWTGRLGGELLSAIRVPIQRRRQRAQQRMLERAIRKQGIAWLASADYSDFES